MPEHAGRPLNPVQGRKKDKYSEAKVISAMVNSSALFIVQNWPGMEWIKDSYIKIACIMVQKSPDYCSIYVKSRLI